MRKVALKCFLSSFLLASIFCYASEVKEAGNRGVIEGDNQLEVSYQGLENEISILRNEIKILRKENLDFKKQNSNIEEGLVLNKNEITKNKEIVDFNVAQNSWGSFLLACVAVIITALGVGIALLAFWGYKNIKSASIDASVKSAIEKSENAITEAIEGGSFNVVINSAVERAVYRGILSADDFPEPDPDAV